VDRAHVARLAAAALACLTIGGCGKALSPRARGEGGSAPVAAVGAHGAGGLSTKNTTRLGGSSTAVDAAAVALAVYPGLTPSTRPQAVVLVGSGDWGGALAASVLAGGPLRAPLLYGEGATLPQPSAAALRALAPTGAGGLGRAQVIAVGGAGAPAGYLTRTLPGGEPAGLAVAIERLWSVERGGAPRRVIVTAYDGPPAMTMPAAGLAAQTGAPILFVRRDVVPRATAAELRRLQGVSIYLVGPPAVVGGGVARELARYGPVTRVAGATPAANAIAVARFSDGSFGWGVREPGHGLVFANASRPLDGPAAASLSANGDYGPLLLLEDPNRLSPQLSAYLSDLQPGSPPSGPVHGVYNHGWVIGDARAIAPATQAQLDSLLEISSHPGAEPAVASPGVPPESSEPTPTQTSG
jgi:hypothetical protein